MSGYSKVFVFILFVVGFSTNDILSRDILKDRILKYNQIKEEKEEISIPDSSRLFFNMKLITNENSSNKAVQIIKKRKVNSNYILFFSLAVLVLIGYLFRLNFTFNIYQEAIPFFRLRMKGNQDYTFIKSFVIHLLFCLLLSYQLLTATYSNLESLKENWVEILLYMSVFILFRYFMIGLIATTFNSKSIFKRMNQYWLNLLYFFICIALPVTLLVSLNKNIALDIISYLLIALFIFLYVFSVIKILYNEMNIIQTSVVKFVIYLYVVEFIPIILLVKHLRNYFLIS